MYGWINATLEEYVIVTFGLHIWQKIRESANSSMPSGESILGVYYDDESTRLMLKSASKLLCLPIDQLLEGFGSHFVKYLEAKGFGNLLAGQARTMSEWIQNINEPHRILRGRFPKGSLPEFRTELDTKDPTGNTIILHYYSTRSGGLGAIVVGVIREVARRYFSQEIIVDLLLSEEMGNSGFVHHSIWRIPNIDDSNINSGGLNVDHNTHKHQLHRTRPFSNNNDPPLSTMQCPFRAASHLSSHTSCDSFDTGDTSSSKSELATQAEASTTDNSDDEDMLTNGCAISAYHFKKIFPFHLVVNQCMRIVQVGEKLSEMMAKQGVQALGQDVRNLFSLQVGNACHWDWKSLCQWQNNAINLRFLSPNNQAKWHFTGGITILDDNCPMKAVAALLINPCVSSMKALNDLDLKMSDLPRHSFQRDILHMEDQITSEIANTVRMTELSNRLERESQKAQDALRTKRIFVRYVSHEVRTPLNVASLGLRYMNEVLSQEVASPLSARHRSLSEVDSQPSPVSEKVIPATMMMADVEQLRDVLNDVQDSCDLAVDILNDLLLYEKIDDGVFTINPSPIALHRILHEADKLFHLLSKGCGINFIMESSLSPHQIQSTAVNIDRSKFHQVLRNLFTNAIKFTPPNGTVTVNVDLFENDDPSVKQDGSIVFGTQSISSHSHRLHNLSRNTSSGIMSNVSLSSVMEDLTLTSFTSHGTSFSIMRSFTDQQPTQVQSQELANVGDKVVGPFLRLSIVDNGCGITREQQQKLFHEFVHVQEDKLEHGHGSAGLGLWICMNIMHVHGGRIGVASDGEGCGSTFVLDLPLSDALPTSHGSSTPASPAVHERELSHLPLNNNLQQCHQKLGNKNLLAVSSLANKSPRTFKKQLDIALNHHSSSPPTTVAKSPAQAQTRSGFFSTSRTPPRTSCSSSTTSASSASNTKLSLTSTLPTSRSPPPPPPSASPSQQRHQQQPEQVGTKSRVEFMKRSLRRIASKSMISLASNCNLLVENVETDTVANAKTTDAEKSHNNPDITRRPSLSRLVPSVTIPPLKLVDYTTRCLQSRVLIVDDAPLNRKMVRRILQRHFGEIEEAEDGEQAVLKYTKSMALNDDGNNAQKFDLILMDFMMPVKNGLDATKEIRAMDPTALIVGVTGNGLEEDLQAFAAAGAKAVFVKPLRLETLEELLRDVWNL